jgi:hypothetical protein
MLAPRSGNDSENGCVNVGVAARPPLRARRNESGVAMKTRR